MSRAAATRSVTVNGAELHYQERGSGPACVLLHGGLSSSELWAELFPLLEGELRVLALDARGHGRSTNPASALSYGALADDVAGFIAALALEAPIVCGWSDGGLVALELGVRHPGAARALIAGAAVPDFDDRWQREATMAFVGADATGTPDLARLEANLGDFLGLARSWHPGGEAQWRAILEQTAQMWLTDGGLSRAEVERIEVPVLVLAGDRDEMTPLAEAAVLLQVLPAGELAICPQAGHLAVLERAPLLAGMIRDFAARHAAGSGR